MLALYLVSDIGLGLGLNILFPMFYQALTSTASDNIWRILIDLYSLSDKLLIVKHVKDC